MILPDKTLEEYVENDIKLENDITLKNKEKGKPTELCIDRQGTYYYNTIIKELKNIYDRMAMKVEGFIKKDSISKLNIPFLDISIAYQFALYFNKRNVKLKDTDIKPIKLHISVDRFSLCIDKKYLKNELFIEKFNKIIIELIKEFISEYKTWIVFIIMYLQQNTILYGEYVYTGTNYYTNEIIDENIFYLNSNDINIFLNLKKNEIDVFKFSKNSDISFLLSINNIVKIALFSVIFLDTNNVSNMYVPRERFLSKPSKETSGSYYNNLEKLNIYYPDDFVFNLISTNISTIFQIIMENTLQKHIDENFELTDPIEGSIYKEYFEIPLFQDSDKVRNLIINKHNVFKGDNYNKYINNINKGISGDDNNIRYLCYDTNLDLDLFNLYDLDYVSFPYYSIFTLYPIIPNKGNIDEILNYNKIISKNNIPCGISYIEIVIPKEHINFFIQNSLIFNDPVNIYIIFNTNVIFKLVKNNTPDSRSIHNGFLGTYGKIEFHIDYDKSIHPEAMYSHKCILPLFPYTKSKYDIDLKKALEPMKLSEVKSFNISDYMFLEDPTTGLNLLNIFSVILSNCNHVKYYDKSLISYISSYLLKYPINGYRFISHVIDSFIYNPNRIKIANLHNERELIYYYKKDFKISEPHTVYDIYGNYKDLIGLRNLYITYILENNIKIIVNMYAFKYWYNKKEKIIHNAKYDNEFFIVWNTYYFIIDFYGKLLKYKDFPYNTLLRIYETKTPALDLESYGFTTDKKYGIGFNNSDIATNVLNKLLHFFEDKTESKPPATVTAAGSNSNNIKNTNSKRYNVFYFFIIIILVTIIVIICIISYIIYERFTELNIT